MRKLLANMLVGITGIAILATIIFFSYLRVYF